MSLQQIENSSLWGLQAPQVEAIKTLVEQLTNKLPTSIQDLSSVTYDGSNRITQFVSDGITYNYSYPDATTINLIIQDAGRTVLKRITLNGSGQVSSIATL